MHSEEGEMAACDGERGPGSRVPPTFRSRFDYRMRV
jgi:hypothetical protein